MSQVFHSKHPHEDSGTNYYITIIGYSNKGEEQSKTFGGNNFDLVKLEAMGYILDHYGSELCPKKP